MILKKTISLFFFLATFQIQAQVWSTGILALNDGEHIIGDIRYDYESNTVQVKYEDVTKTFAANQFYSFKIVENELFPARNFYVLNYKDKGDLRVTPKVFECLYYGEVSLMTRSRETEFPQYGGDALNRRQRPDYMVYSHFLVWSDGRVKKLEKGKKARIEAFGNEKKRLKDFVKRHRLDIRTREDIYYLVRYYNELLEGKDLEQGQYSIQNKGQ